MWVRKWGGGRRTEGGVGGTKRRSDLLNTIRLSTVMTRVCKYYFACTRGQSMTCLPSAYSSLSLPLSTEYLSLLLPRDGIFARLNELSDDQSK